MSYELGVLAAEAGWRDAYRELGILRKGDFANDDPVIIGLYGGYGYLNVSYLRMIGVRAPGSSPEAIDLTLFGEGNPPPYAPRKGDKSLLSTLRILGTVLKALAVQEPPPVVADSYRLVEQWEARQPPLDADDARLVAYLDEFPALFRQTFRNHLMASSLAAIVSGVLADNAKAAGDPGLATRLLGASGGCPVGLVFAGVVRGGKTGSCRPGADGHLRCRHRRAGRPPVRHAAGAGVQSRIRGVHHPTWSSRPQRLGDVLAHVGEHPDLALVAIDRMRLADYDLSPQAGWAMSSSSASRCSNACGRT
jgi:pyruvate,water dikinase